MSALTALSAIPAGLREPLLTEYRSITQNYAEHRWSPSELSGGRFCEIVYSVIDGYAKQRYAPKPSKPRDFVSSCRKLESNTNVPRSFQVLIPRMLPGLYEVRNNRGVGHAGGDVDPNHMDATVVLSTCNWILAELVRVFHNLPIDEAQHLVDSLAERRTPLIWQEGNTKRILNPSIKVADQILLLLASEPTETATQSLLEWTEYKNRNRFLTILRKLHSDRMLELSKNGVTVRILPPGTSKASELFFQHESR